MEVKFCKICQEDHPLTGEYWFFFKRPNGTAGSQCKKNKQKKNNEYNQKNRDRLLTQQRESYKLNSEKFKDKREKNKDKQASYMKKYREKNKGKLKELNKIWKESNKEYVKEKARIYQQNNPRKSSSSDSGVAFKERYRTDPQFKLKVNLRNRLRQAIYNKSKVGSAVKELGGIDNAVKHIESQFHPNPLTNEPMTWSNHGRGGWHLDHVIPLSKFDLEDGEQFKKACHYTNLQPLWEKRNLQKSNKMLPVFDLGAFLTGMGYRAVNTGFGETWQINNGIKELYVRIIRLDKQKYDPLWLRELGEKDSQRLVQFYITEFVNHPDIIRSMILNYFGQSKKIDARDCQIMPLKNKQAAEFFNQNHLMGNHPTASCFGLFYGHDLVAAISYKRKDNGIEISRFASKVEYSVRGGFSKLISYLSKNIKTKEDKSIQNITSFCDMRYASGASYTACGFEFVGHTQGFSWTDGYSLYNRLYCRANMDERGLTEAQHAEEKGLIRINDAGQVKFALKLS